MKDECEGATQSFIYELEWCFPEHQVMIAFSVVYP